MITFSSDYRKLAFFLFLFSGSALIAFLILFFGMRQFGGVDGGAVINLAWQQHLGQRPYHEIIVGFPPLFMLGLKLAVQWFGMRWSSFVIFTAIFSVGLFVLNTWILCRAGVRWGWSLGLSFTVQILTNASIGWWWYNHLTASLACLYLVAVYLILLIPEDKIGWLVAAMAGALLSLAKPNIAGLLLFFSGVIFLCNKRYWKAGSVVIGLAAALGTLILFLYGATWRQVLFGYTYYSARLLSFENFIKFLLWNNNIESYITFIFLGPAAVAAVKAWQSNFSSKGSLWWWAAAAIFTGIMAMGTNNDLNFVDTVLILTGIFLGIWSAQKYLDGRRRNRIFAWFLASLILFNCAVIGIAVFRTRIQTIGEGTFFENKPLQKVVVPGVMHGMWVGPKFVQVNHEIAAILNRYGYVNCPQAPVFFGLRLEYAYAAFGIQPKAGLPFVWESFQNDYLPQTQLMVENFKAAGYQLAVFYHHDYTFLPPSLLRYLQADFQVYDYGWLTVHRKRRN